MTKIILKKLKKNNKKYFSEVFNDNKIYDYIYGNNKVINFNNSLIKLLTEVIKMNLLI